MRLAFCVDGYAGQAGVEVRQDAAGDVRGTAHLPPGTDPAAVRDQVARVLSLDHDATEFVRVGERDPVIGRLQAAAPHLGRGAHPRRREPDPGPRPRRAGSRWLAWDDGRVSACSRVRALPAGGQRGTALRHVVVPVKGKIFATVPPGEEFLHVFVDEADIAWFKDPAGNILSVLQPR